MSRLHLSIHARARRLVPCTVLALTVATPAVAADAKYFVASHRRPVRRQIDAALDGLAALFTLRPPAA